MVQQNAASAEESSSAAVEMSAQSEEMKGMVNELLTLVARKAAKKHKLLLSRGREVNPNDVIPLDDTD